jgi:hypothetical protein
MSHAKERNLRLRRLCLEDTISTFSVSKDFLSGDDRFTQRLGFSDLHEIASDGNRISTLTIDEFCTDFLSSVTSACEKAGAKAHVWLRGRALTGKTWTALRVMVYMAQAALDQLDRSDMSALESTHASLLPLPLFIPALKLARSRPSTVESYIRSSHGLDASDELVRFLLEELECKRILLFIDGLDDITRHRPLVLKHIEDVLLPSHPCVFLTSRREAVHWLSASAFSSARSFATDVASFDPQVYPIFLESMTAKQMATMRYLLSLKFNLPPHDLVTSHSPGQPLIDCVGGLAIASNLVLRDATSQSSMSIVVQWCEAYLRELLFAADSRKFVLISSDVDVERGRDQRLLGSPACLSLLESIAFLALEKNVRTARGSGDALLPPVQFSDEDVSSVIEANPQYGGIWSCLFKSSPVINWGARNSSPRPNYTFSHPFLLHLVVARATAARLHAGESIPWLLTRRIVLSREHRGLLFMLASMLRCESFMKLVSSLATVVPSFMPSTFVLALALTAHRPNQELQSSDTKAMISAIKSNGFPVSSLSSLILHSCSPGLRSFVIDIVRASDTAAMLSLFVDALALVEAVSGRVLPNSDITALRVLACIHFLLKFVDEVTSMSVDIMLNHCLRVIEILSVVAADADQLDFVRLQAVECMFAYLNCAMRAVSHNSEYSACLISSIAASLKSVASFGDAFRQTVCSHIKSVPFICQAVADHQLHQQACLLIRSGFDDVRLFPSVSIEVDSSQSDRRMSAVLAAASLCSREDMRALILAHLRDSSRNVRSAVASALKSFPYESLSSLEFHNISMFLCVSLQLESVPEVVAALMVTLASIFPRLLFIPCVVLDAMQQHPAVFDLLGHWIFETHFQSRDAASLSKLDSDSSLVGPEFLTLDQLLQALLIMKDRDPTLPPSLSCKLILIFSVILSSRKSVLDMSCCDDGDLADISLFLVAAAASVGPHPSPAPAPHSCSCSFIRMCGSKYIVPLFLQVDVPRLFLLAGLQSTHSQSIRSSDIQSPGNMTLSKDEIGLSPHDGLTAHTVSFSLQRYYLNAGTNEVILAGDSLARRYDELHADDEQQHSCLLSSGHEADISLQAVRSQLVNEFVLELFSSVQSCVNMLSKDDPQTIASACRGACAFVYSIVSGCCSFDVSKDLLCQALSLSASAGILSMHIAATKHNFSVTAQSMMEQIVTLTSHSSSRVRVAAFNVLCSEFTSFSRFQASPTNFVAEYSVFCSNHLDMFASIRRVLLAALKDDSDLVVSTALNCLASVVHVDSEVATTLFDAVAESLKQTLTLCLSKFDGRINGAAKVQVLLEYTVSSLFSEAPPDLSRIERSCVEIRRICKWFPSSHKPPPCTQQLRLQAVKAASLLLSCKRLCSQVFFSPRACFFYAFMYLLGESSRNCC